MNKKRGQPDLPDLASLSFFLFLISLAAALFEATTAR